MFENASASIGPDARRSHLVYRNAGPSDHPEFEARIISFFSSLSAVHIVQQLVLHNLRLCWWCSVSYVCLRCRPEAGLTVTFKKMHKILFVN